MTHTKSNVADGLYNELIPFLPDFIQKKGGRIDHPRKFSLNLLKNGRIVTYDGTNGACGTHLYGKDLILKQAQFLIKSSGEYEMVPTGCGHAHFDQLHLEDLPNEWKGSVKLDRVVPFVSRF